MPAACKHACTRPTQAAAAAWQHNCSAAAVYGLYAGFSFLSTLPNSLGERPSMLINQFGEGSHCDDASRQDPTRHCAVALHMVACSTGGMLNIGGAVLLTALLPAIAAPNLQPARWVFGHFETAQGEAVGISSRA